MKTKTNFLKIMLAMIVISLSMNVSKGEITYATVSPDTVLKLTQTGTWEVNLLLNQNHLEKNFSLKIDILGAQNFYWYENGWTGDSILAEKAISYHCDFDIAGNLQSMAVNVHYHPQIDDMSINYLGTIDLHWFVSYQWMLLGNMVSNDSILHVTNSGEYILITTDEGGYEGRDTFNISCINYPFNPRLFNAK